MRVFGLFVVSVLSVFLDLPYIITFTFHQLISIVICIYFPFICQKVLIFNATEEDCQVPTNSRGARNDNLPCYLCSVSCALLISCPMIARQVFQVYSLQVGYV